MDPKSNNTNSSVGKTMPDVTTDSTVSGASQAPVMPTVGPTVPGTSNTSTVQPVSSQDSTVSVADDADLSQDQQVVGAGFDQSAGPSLDVSSAQQSTPKIVSPEPVKAVDSSVGLSGSPMSSQTPSTPSVNMMDDEDEQEESEDAGVADMGSAVSPKDTTSTT